MVHEAVQFIFAVAHIIAGMMALAVVAILGTIVAALIDQFGSPRARELLRRFFL